MLPPQPQPFTAAGAGGVLHIQSLTGQQLHLLNSAHCQQSDTEYATATEVTRKPRVQAVIGTTCATVVQ